MDSIETALKINTTEPQGTCNVTCIIQLVGGWLVKIMNDLETLLHELFEGKSSILSISS